MNNLKNLDINLSSLKEQTIAYQCPYCFEDILDDNIIGETIYDVVRIGHDIGGTAVIMKCNHCKKLSFIHKESLGWRIH